MVAEVYRVCGVYSGQGRGGVWSQSTERVVCGSFMGRIWCMLEYKDVHVNPY